MTLRVRFEQMVPSEALILYVHERAREALPELPAGLGVTLRLDGFQNVATVQLGARSSSAESPADIYAAIDRALLAFAQQPQR